MQNGTSLLVVAIPPVIYHYYELLWSEHSQMKDRYPFANELQYIRKSGQTLDHLRII